jgi:hypothetical protein
VVLAATMQPTAKSVFFMCKSPEPCTRLFSTLRRWIERQSRG